MTDFLNNPEENIAAFGSPLKDKLQKRTSPTEKLHPEVIPQPKKNKTSLSKVAGEDNNNEATIHIRISKGVELAVREALLAYYKSTGKKFSLREYADRALREYLDKLMLK